MTPQSRLLFVAAVFAVLAIVAFGAIWLWPMLNHDTAPADEFAPITEEQKEDIRAQLKAEMQKNQGIIVSEEEQEDIRAQLETDASSGPVVSETEQENIRAQLRAQMRQ